MKSYTRHYPRAAVLAALVLVASCGEPADPPNLMVASKWTDAIRRFNLVPIYPMQEDVQIGDVFLYLPPRPGERADSQPVILAQSSRGSQPGDRANGIAQRVLPTLSACAGRCGTLAQSAATLPSAPTTPVTVETTTNLRGVATTQRLTIPAEVKTSTVPGAAKPMASTRTPVRPV